jgi:hypothetical protein
MARAEFRRTIEARIEEAADRLLIEAAAGPAPPPLPESAVTRLAEIKLRT